MRYQIVSKKPLIIIGLIILVVLAGLAFWIIKKKGDHGREEKNQPIVYEALVQVIDEKIADPVEDARASLKKGDVIAIFPQGHTWSETEKASYLILKLELKEEDSRKLLEAEEKEGQSEETQDGMARKNREIVRARKYRLKVEKLDFDPQKLFEGQPYPDKVFDAKMIEEKD